MSGIDVLILTALPDEYGAATAVAGLSGLRAHDTDGQAPYATGTYRVGDGRELSVALARPTRMSGRSIGSIGTTLTNQLRPTCLAMAGVCAGNPRATAPGDVVVAAPAYQWDEGKYTGDGFRADPQQFPLDSRWERAVQEFDPSGLPSHGAATDEEAEIWYLERLHQGQDPRRHPARRRYLPQERWSATLHRLESKDLITWQDSELVLTDAGRARISRVLYIDIDGPQRLPFEVAAGPMASGNAVMADAQVWERLEVAQRKILALEMEAATVATIAHERQVPRWLVVKGVMDHAGADKDDRFKQFAAKASAEVLFALLGDLIRPAATVGRSGPAGGTVPGAVKLEVLRRLTYDWQDLAEIVGVPPWQNRRFRAGDEPRALWDWLVDRDRLADLPGALDDIGRADLADLLRPYV